MTRKIGRRLLWAATVIYAAVLVKLILFKTKIGPVLYNSMEGLDFMSNLRSSNLIPIRGIISLFGGGNSTLFILQNLVGNLVGFMPLGFLYYYLYSPVTLQKVFKVAFFTSLAFEVVQILFVLGHFDVDDIILNTLGGVLGYVVGRVLYKTFTFLRRIKSFSRRKS